MEISLKDKFILQHQLTQSPSYPTGGKNTHAVISAHRGVPNAELFTRLPALKKATSFLLA